jgi:hypothetical protein
MGRAFEKTRGKMQKMGIYTQKRVKNRRNQAFLGKSDSSVCL